MTKAISHNLTCCLCGQLYTDPVILSPCSHTFDRHCILRCSACPIGHCNAPVFEHCLVPNVILRDLADQNNQLANSTYEIFLLDTSTSMWYSDFFFGLIGTSRFQMAIKFLRETFQQRWNSTTNRISLVTFDTNPIEQFPFEIAREYHLKALDNLRPSGSYTALFDAVKFCLEKFQKLNQIVHRSTAQCLYILTDGGDNFSASGNQQHYINFIKTRSNQLNIIGHIIQVGDTNLLTTKQLCDEINYKFHHFNGGNASQFVNSFISTTDYQAKNNLEETIKALPDACTAPVRPVSQEKKIGILA